MNRRQFIRASLAATVSTGIRPHINANQPGTGFFSVRKTGGRWWFIRPNGEKYFSLGLNHIDPATLRYEENIHIWREKYGNSMERWLKESVPEGPIAATKIGAHLCGLGSKRGQAGLREFCRKILHNHQEFWKVLGGGL